VFELHTVFCKFEYLMRKFFFIIYCFILFIESIKAQLPVGRDTFSVYENGKLLKMPLGGGLNFCNLSNIDLNLDGIDDVVAYDKITSNAYGRFKCFIKKGVSGQTIYESAPELNYRFPRVDNWALLLDYNGDGKKDIFASASGGVQVYKNISTLTAGLTFSLVNVLVQSRYNPPNNNSKANLLVSSVSLPGIADIDGDGDLDILTFSSNGIMVEYHQNKSKELYGHADSLTFDLVNGCWGKFSENNCVVQFNQCPNKPLSEKIEAIQQSLHAGSCIMCFDRNNDGDQDLVLGDISCDNVTYLENTGTSTTAIVTDTARLYPNYPIKNNTQRIRFNSFPCTYNLDIDGDNLKDLVASPNATGANHKSVWYYRNAGTLSNPNFIFTKDNLFQDEMIELGQGANPAYVDYDNDGKKDLIIGNNGYYTNNSSKAQLALYRNIGTLSQPAFSLITKDYLGLSANNFLTISPTVGDIDSDGDVDILFCNHYGNLSWIENTAGAGNACNFSILKNNTFSITPFSSEGYPQLIDMDLDGKLDVMMGMRNGSIAYYKNNGTLNSPSFSLITNTFGNIDIEGNIFRYLNEGYAAPYFYRENGQLKLLLGNVEGRLFLYNIPSNLTSPPVLIASDLNSINEGENATPLYEDIDGDSKRDLLLGNFSGGLSYFSSKKSVIGIKEIENNQTHFSSIYPNPATNYLMVEITDASIEKYSITIFNSLGQLVKESSSNELLTSIDLNDLSTGVYIVKVKSNSNRKTFAQTHKLIKQ
jgi:hypothetical protein